MYVKIIKDTKRQRVGQVVKTTYQVAYKYLKEGYAEETTKEEYDKYVKSLEPCCEECKEKPVKKKKGCGCGS